MIDQPDHRPSEVARTLGVSPATLRRWSQHFAAFLSPQAGLRQDGDKGHRRYHDGDIAVLRRLQALLQEGMTYAQVQEVYAQELAVQPEDIEEEGLSDPAVEVEEIEQQVLDRLPSTGFSGADIAHIIADTLSSLSDSQQIILGGQQTERQLLGVVLQDNFNLKEENARLRERMLETERKIFELKRELDKERGQEKERMRQMESQLFEMQKRLDGLAQRQSRVQAPSAAMPPPQSQAPPRPQPQTPKPSPSPETEARQATPPKRSFWQRFFGG